MQGSRRHRQRWDPRYLPSLGPWYRLDLGVTLASGKVSALQSLNGNSAYNLTQGTAGKQPTFTASGIGGLPGMIFAGGQSLGSGTFTILPQPITIYVIGFSNQVAANSTFVEGSAGNKISFDATPTKLQEYALNALVLTSAVNVTTPKVMCAQFNGASSAVFVNNSSINILVAGNPGTSGTDQVWIGARPDDLNPLTGQISEIIYSLALDSLATRQQVFAYAATRYGLSAS